MNKLNPVFEEVESDSLSMPANAEALLRVIGDGVRNTILSGSDREVVFDHIAKTNAQQLLDSGGWNSEDGLGRFLAEQYGVPMPFEAVRLCILRFIHAYCEILQYASKPEVSKEQWDWQLEALYSEYIGLLIGAPVHGIDEPEGE